MSKFKEKAQHLQDHIPMGILDKLLQHRGHDHPNGIFIKDRICSWVDEAKEAFPKCTKCTYLDCYVQYQRGISHNICPPRREWLVEWFGQKIWLD